MRREKSVKPTSAMLNNDNNAVTKASLAKKTSENKKNNYNDTSYKIFVFCEDTRINLLQVDGSDGNGYYGTGYTITVKIKED